MSETRDNAARGAALEYTARGWPVFPVHAPRDGACSCGDADCARPAKHPRTPHGLKDATTAASHVTAWWQRWPDSNVGIRTGVAFDVIDCDGPGMQRFLDWCAEHDVDADQFPRAVTGRPDGGRHVLIAPTGFGNRTAVLEGVDFRGSDGYIVAPPSRHMSGRGYWWKIEPNGTIPAAPPALVELLTPKRAAPVERPMSGGIRSAWAQRALDDELARVVTAAPATGNDQLNRSAFSLGQLVGAGELNEGDVVTLLLRAGTGAGRRTEKEARVTIRSGLEAGRREPRSAPEREKVSAATTGGIGRKNPGAEAVSAETLPPLEMELRQKETGRTAGPAWRTAAELAATAAETVPCVVEGYVAGSSVTEVDGLPKAAGKTTWILRLVAAVLDGADFMGRATRAGGVVLLTEERDSTLRPALKRAGLLRRTDLHILRRVDTAGMSWDAVCVAAGVKCADVGAVLMVVDTLSRWAGLAEDSENKSGSAASAMEPLQRIAGAGLAVIVSRHERKSGGEVGQSGRGSNAFAGDVDVVLSLRRLEGNPSVVAPNARRLDALSRFDETPSSVVIELTEDGFIVHGDDAAIERRRAEAAILAALPGSEADALTFAAMTEAAKVRRTTAQAVMGDLSLEGKVARCGQGKRGDPHRYYRPPIGQASPADHRTYTGPIEHTPEADVTYADSLCSMGDDDREEILL